ncbi:CASTOR/POLLUX-related putative ion channel [Cryobacterium ruanii]|uniref:Potassium transporter TrkA n=1 Tax=Cryobacterium ruanii TaxID=1259197 RepID=A0A4V3ITK7_9MICO|nr:NAD-binding protein [Cryobacterium ruanii]TFD67781.1 potassium transporter TrkA [Cryobacterium ruanii]
MTNSTTFQERFRYWFDSVMARGAGALMALLALASLVFIALVALVVMVFGLFPTAEPGDPSPGFFEVLWGNLMRTLDSGTMGGDAGWGFRGAMLVVTIGGVIMVASLIGIISSAFDSKVDELRKGRSKVLESDHTLILGWSPKIYAIVSEICVANDSRKRSTIVILSAREKVDMEDDLRAQVPNTGRTRIICRSGDPMNLADLEISNPHTARSIVILAPEGNSDPDSVVIKTALALTNNPRRKESAYHIVGEIQHPGNLEAARLVGRDEAHWVLASDLISRITVQSCRQSGLSVVYTELLDFDGHEIYFTEQPNLVGHTYYDAQLSFAESCVMGMVKRGVVHLNPEPDLEYQSGDQLIVIAEDDSTIRMSVPGAADEQAINDASVLAVAPERTLVLGYNSGLHAMLAELDEYVTAASSVTVVADVEDPLFAPFENMSVTFQNGDTTSRALLESLTVETYDHIIVLADKGETVEPQRSDARTLITLLHLRDMADQAQVDLNVVSEMLDDANRELAEVTQADDFIVSDKLISLMLSQISENKHLTDVFSTLFSSDGSEIYLRPADVYIRPGAEVDFYTVLEAARRRGETAIGYRVAEHARSSAHAYGVSVNPNKSQKRSFAADDKIIVLAND